MTELQQQFGITENGEVVTQYTLKNEKICVQLLDYGATIHRILVPDANGQIENVVVSSNDLSLYETSTAYEGKTVGRYANRIANGTFQIGTETYHLNKNENNTTTLHSSGEFSFKLWQVEEHTPEKIVMFLQTDETVGFPGNVNAQVVFTLEDSRLKITYNLVSDKTTVFSPTNHTYFNLAGVENRSIKEHDLYVNAKMFTPIDEKSIPTGEVKPVADTAFDFTTMKKIGEAIESGDEQILLTKGIDHNFCLNASSANEPAAILYDAKSKREMKVYTDLPGVQVYTSNFLEDRTEDGKKTAYQYAGICLETQFYPDTPNQAAFPSCTVEANKIFATTTAFEFVVKQ